MINEEETNENFKEFKVLIDGLKTIFTEFENSSKNTERKKQQKKNLLKRRKQNYINY